MQFFSKKNKKKESLSMADAIRGDKKKTAEEVKREITDALVETETQKELYRTAAQRAIARAKRAVASNNPGEKAIAYNELKFAYGVYHYMDTLHTAFRTIESQLQMRQMTQNFANIVTRLKSIRVPSTNVNFTKLTAIALKEMDSVDFAGLDDMVNQLIHGSINATDASKANDQFLDDLVSGKATLDAPYPFESTEAALENPADADAPAQQETHNAATSTDELLAMLDQINAGLNGQ